MRIRSHLNDEVLVVNPAAEVVLGLLDFEEGALVVVVLLRESFDVLEHERSGEVEDAVVDGRRRCGGGGVVGEGGEHGFLHLEREGDVEVGV